MISVKAIQQAVALEFDIPMLEMISDRRAKRVAIPRMVAVYLVRELTTLSLPAIGRHFGHRDHTTIMHAIDRIEDLASKDAAFGERVWRVRRQMQTNDFVAQHVVPDDEVLTWYDAVIGLEFSP